MAKKEINMCEGPLTGNIIRYTVPIILTGVLQLLFNAADLIVVGQYCGSVCVAAVGATGSVINLLVNLFIGFSAGVSVGVANGIGAGDGEAVHKTVHTGMLFAFICGIVLTFAGLTAGTGILKMMNPPAEIIDLSGLYLKIYFCGMIPSLLYNFGAAILRAAGDTKSPLIFLTVAGIVNIILNILFVTVFKMTVDGVATATVISQTVSCVLVIGALMKRKDSCRLYLSKLRLHIIQLRRIVAIGFPAGIQGCLFSISNIIIQSSVNSFGAVAVAGNSATQNIEGFLYIAMNAFHQTALNFTGQNVGAGKFDRLSKILKTNIICMVVMSVTVSIPGTIFAKPLISLYITDSPGAVEVGLNRMMFIFLPYFICGIMDVLTGTIRGMGESLIPMIISVFFVCIFRIIWIFTLFQAETFHTLSWLYASYPVSWTLCIAAQLIAYRIILKKLRRSYGI